MTTYVTSRDLAEQVKRQVKYGVTQKDIAKQFGISAAYLCDFLQGRREAGPKILRALGYDPIPRYKRQP